MARTRKQKHRKGGKLQEPKFRKLMDIIKEEDVTELETLFTNWNREDVEIVNDYIDDEKDDISKPTPLTLAVKTGNVGIVKMLLKHGADPFFQDGTGNVPIVLAMGNPELFKAIIDINKLSLCLSIYTHNIDLVKAVIKAVGDVNIFCDPNRNTPLSHAVSNGTLDMVEALIDAGAHIDSSDISGATPLHYAANTGRLDMVNKLIASGADVNAKDNDGVTPLQFATDNGSIDVINVLIAKGADVNAQNNDGQTAMHIAVNNWNTVIILALAKAGANPHAKDTFGGTPFLLAKSHEPYDESTIFQMLAPSRSQTPLPVSPLPESPLPETPLPASPPPLIGGRASEEQQKTLINAVESGNTEAVQEALTPEIDIDEALLIAIRMNNTKIVEILLSRTGITDALFDKAIRSAATYSGADMLEVIKHAIIERVKLDAGTPSNPASLTQVEDQSAQTFSHYITRTDTNGDTPLHLAAKSNNKKDTSVTISMVQSLLNYGADIEAKNTHGQTPLHYVVRFGCVPILEALIRLGADIEAMDNRGETPLHKSANLGCKELVDVLISRGADVNARDGSGDIPFAQAVLQVARGKEVDNNESIARALKDAGSDINLKNSGGLTALHQITTLANNGGPYKNAMKAVTLLIELGANLEETTTNYPKTALITALTPNEGNVSDLKFDLARLLIDKGADVNATDSSSGRTALHMACMRSNGEATAIALIDKGANISAKTTTGNLPLHLALCSKLKDVVVRLVDMGADVTAPFGACTPLSIALTPLYTSPKDLLDCEEMALAIIAKLNNEELKRSDGILSPIHKAARNGFLRVVTELVRRGVDINTPANTDRKQTPLQIALEVTPPNQAMITYLSNADPETADI